MNAAERDGLIVDIAKRVLAERDCGRKVDPGRIAWAEGVLKPPVSPTHEVGSDTRAPAFGAEA